MPTAQESFRREVIDAIQVPLGGAVFSYANYLALPEADRANDEADVVDMQFSRAILAWLGYESGDTTYNRPIAGRKADKPDYSITVLGATAFMLEDKNSTEPFTDWAVQQLRRYTAGTAGYGLWTNARLIVGLRFEAGGSYQILVEVRVESVFGKRPAPVGQEDNFEMLRLLFGKDRFAGAAGLISSIAVDEQEWRRQAHPLSEPSALDTFILETRTVLDQLAIVVRSRLNTVALNLEDARADLVASRQRYSQIVTDLIDKLSGQIGGAGYEPLRTALLAFQSALADVDIMEIERLKPALNEPRERDWYSALGEIRALIAALREREMGRAESRRIHNAYLLWRERHRFIEDDQTGSDAEVESRRRHAFAEQVGYVFFVRLLLARVLEDKGIMPRLVSDGGFAAWYAFLKAHATDADDEIRGESLLPLVYRRVASFYRHFFQQPVFDWFLPDDYLVALVLGRLNGFTFADVTNDLLGFAYEAFIDRVARNRKGHFLTPPEIVEYMLDRAGYAGPGVIGERMLDTSCGSASFLVHAARRLRAAMAAQMAGQDTLALARAFVTHAATDLVGLEINPFSCYLAELNLFIQVLDDLVLLWQAGERLSVDRFAIYNTNSLEMPRPILHAAPMLFDDQAALDEAAPIKRAAGQFGYVICNPPYVNRGIILGARSYGDLAFYREIVTGDENFYLLFLRLAAYYIAPGGVICFICPLNLLGDESTQGARTLFGATDWRIAGITRFYARNVLFRKVLQGVCVVRFDRVPGVADDLVEIRGGGQVAEAASRSVMVPREQVTNSYPRASGDARTRPWLVHADPAVYEFWQAIRANTTMDTARLIEDKLEAREGDIRSTWAKPLITAGPGKGIVPLTKGSRITDWGGWTVESYLDPQRTVPVGIKDYKSSLWTQRAAQRIAGLTETETAIFLKEISGLEMRRPVRGTIVERDGAAPVAADHTVLVLRTKELVYGDLAHAVFGLLTSSTYSFLFTLFSTNAHVSLRELLRMPVPPWTADLESRLAAATRAALAVSKDLEDHERRFGRGADRRHIAAPVVLAAFGGRTLTLEQLVLRGEAALSGPANRTIGVLHEGGHLTINTGQGAGADAAIQEVLAAHASLVYAREGKSVLVPHPTTALSFAATLAAAAQERIGRLAAVDEARRRLDDLILDAYGITEPAWRDMVALGVPWVRD